MRLFGENDSDGRRLAEIDPCFNDGFRGRLGWDPSIRHGPWLVIVLGINQFVGDNFNQRPVIEVIVFLLLMSVLYYLGYDEM